MRKFLFLFIISFLIESSAKAGLDEVVNTKNFKKEYGVNYTTVKNLPPAKTPKKSSTKKPAPKPESLLNVFVISNVNLFIPPSAKNPPNPALGESSIENNPYPDLNHNISFTEFTQKLLQRTYIQAPNKLSSSLYYESETLLNKALQEIIFSVRSKPVDMVIFGGNQVYSNDFMRYFKEMAYVLDSYKIPNYQVLGASDLRGPEITEKLIKDKYYMLKTRMVNFLILDNTSQEIIPERIPEEANDQTIWLAGMLKKLNESQEELVIILHNPLTLSDINYINQFTKLNLKLIINSSKPDFKKSYESRLISNPVVINNPSMISYPCSYLNIQKDSQGEFDVRPIMIDLQQIQNLARSRTGARN